MSMASEDCASDHHLFLSEPLETKAVVAAAGEAFLGDVGVQGEVASDETVQEQCGLSDLIETPMQGVRTEASEKELIQEVDGFLSENEAAEGVDSGETKEAACEDEGTEEAPAEALEDEPIENSLLNGASDAAPDAKTIQAKVSDEEELVMCLEYQEEENIKIPKEEVVEDLSVENVATDTMASKSEKELTEEEFDYDLDQEKENEPPIGIEAERNAVVEDVGRDNIVSDTPQAEGEAGGENGVKEQIKDGRTGVESEAEQKLFVEDVANEIIAAKETGPVLGPMDGMVNDDPIEYTILTPEPPNASEVVAMDRATDDAEDGPIRTVGVERKEKIKTDALTFEPVQSPEFEANASLEKEGIEAKTSEKIVREIDEGKVENTLNVRSKVIEAEKRDSIKKPSVTTLVLNWEGNARKEQGNGKQSGKLMSRVKSSLGKVRKAIIGRPPPSLKTIVVDARLEERSNEDCHDQEHLVNH